MSEIIRINEFNEPTSISGSTSRIHVNLSDRRAINPLLAVPGGEPNWLPTMLINTNQDRTNTGGAGTSSSAFTEPYDRDRASRLIGTLNDGDYRTRQAADDTLHRMGPLVLHDLAEIDQRGLTLEHRRRIDALGERIRQTNTREVVDRFVQESAGIAATVRRAGVSFAPSQATRLTERRYDESGLHEAHHGFPLRQALTDQERRAFETVIARGAQLPRNFDALTQAEVNNPARYNAMIAVGMAREADQLFALALSVSPEANDRQLARRMLTDMLGRESQVPLGPAFARAFVILGMDTDAANVDRYRAVGGGSDLEVARVQVQRWQRWTDVPR